MPSRKTKDEKEKNVAVFVDSHDLQNKINQAETYSAAQDTLNTAAKLYLHAHSDKKTSTQIAHYIKAAYPDIRTKLAALKQETAPRAIKRRLADDLGLHNRVYLEDLEPAHNPKFSPSIKRRNIAPRPGWSQAVLVDQTSPSQVEFQKIHQRVPQAMKQVRLYQIGVPGDGYVVIECDVSIIIYDELTGKPAILIIRNVTADCEAGPLVRLELDKTFVEIVDQRKDVRPGQKGWLIAYGLNAGQRHCRIFGAVANVIKAGLKTGTARREIDMKFLGVMSFVYAIYGSRVPQEIMREISEALGTLGLPPVFTETIPPGTGYAFDIAGESFVFPQASRPPPEGYVAKDYSARAHKDSPMLPYTLAYYPAYTTTDKIEYHSSVPVVCRDQTLEKGGLDFVSVNYKVIIRASPDSILVFDSGLVHGTTPAIGVTNSATCNTVSTSTVAAFKAALETRIVRGLPEGVFPDDILVGESEAMAPGHNI